MSGKPKQPFLKRGTRQFLSNAQVRSLNNKPKTVDFTGEDDYEPQERTPQVTFGSDRSKSQKPMTEKLPSKADRFDRPIPTVSKRVQPQKVVQFAEDPVRKIEQFKRQMQGDDDDDTIFVAKPKPKYSAPPMPTNNRGLVKQQSQKSSNSGAPDSNLNMYLNRKRPQNSISTEQPLSNSKNSESKSSSKQVNMSRQELIVRPAAASSTSTKNRAGNKYVFEDEPEEEQSFDNQYRRGGDYQPSSAKKQQIRQVEPPAPKPKKKQLYEEDYEEKPAIDVEEDRFSDHSSEEKTKRTTEYNFDDKQEWEEPDDGIMKRSLLKKQLREHKDRLYKDIESHKTKEPPKQKFKVQVPEQEPQYQQPAVVQQQQPSPIAAPKSKLVQKYFYGNEKGNNSKQQLQQGITKNKPSFSKQPTQEIMTIEDVPEDVKLKIIEEGVYKMKERLQQEVDRVKNEGGEVRRVKNKYEQELRLLERARRDFDKEIEQKRLQFEDHIKQQKAKIAKDKKVIKDSLENKYTRKEKQEIDELKKEIEETKQEKRKSEGKFRMEIERLKKKLQEEQNHSRQLQEQVKILQLGRIRQKETLKQRQQTNKQTIKANAILTAASNNANTVIQIPKKKDEQDQQIDTMKQDEFSLLQLPKEAYRYENNIHYRQYCGDRESQDQLESEKCEQDRIKRTYKSGRIQHQYFKKYIKEIFPNGYTIVHHVNGDIKQSLPEGIVIYYVHVSQIVQFTINPNKKILYFAKQAQVQMTVQTPSGTLHEVYDGCTLNRKLPDGSSQVIQANGGGKVISKPNNTKVSYGNGSKQISHPKQLRNF